MNLKTKIRIFESTVIPSNELWGTNMGNNNEASSKTPIDPKLHVKKYPEH